MSSGEQNQNFDLKQQALKEFELKDVKELLSKTKSSAFKVDKNIFKNLDNNDTELSDTEKQLYEQSKEALVIIKFLESIVLELEKKEIKGNNFGPLKSKIKIPENINEQLNKNELKEFTEITSTFISYENLKKNSKARKKILEIDGSGLNICPASHFKDGKNKDLQSIKEEIAQIETNIIKEKLKGLVNEKELEKIVTGKCDSEKLAVLLLEKGFSQDETLEITSNNILNKDIKNSIKLRYILQNKSITINEIIKLKNNDKRILFLKEKGFTLEEVDYIIKLVSEKLNLKKQKKELIQKILSFGVEGYNYFSNEYYKNNQQDIIKISDKNKFITVIKNLKLEKPDKNLIFFNLSNPSFRNDFNLLKEFHKINKEKFFYSSIKDINFKQLNKNEKTEFLEMINKDILNIILLQNENEIRKLNNIKFTTLLNRKINNNETTNDIEYEEDTTKIDNTINKLIKENPENGTEILKNLDYSIDELLMLPKTLSYILSNYNLINHYLKKEPSFYNLLPTNKQKTHNLKYIDSVLKNSTNISRDLALLQFSNLENLIITFNKIKKNKPIIIQELFSRPLFKLTLLNFQKKHSSERKTLSEKHKNDMKEIFGVLKEYGEINNKYKDIYKKSNIEQNIKQTYDKESIFSLKGNEIGNLISKFSENGFDKIQNKIISTIDEYVKNPGKIKNILNTDIAGKLGEKNYTIFLKELKIIIDSYFSIPSKITKKEQKGINKNYYNERSGEIIIKNFKSDYLIKLENAKNKYKYENKKFDQITFTKEYVEKIFPNLSKNKKNELISQIIYRIGGGNEKFNKVTHNKKLIQAIVNGNQKEIDKYITEINTETDNDIKKYNETQLAKKSIKREDKENTISTQNYSFSPETGTISLSENGIEKNITLTPAERLLIDKYKPKNPNEENLILNNIVDFYKTLDRIGLSKLWTIKENLFKSIKNAKGIGFKIDKDYLNENEIKIFLNSILKSVGEDEISPVFTLNNFISVIEQKNKTQIGGNEAIVNTYYGETYLENKLFSKFVPREGTIIGFNRTNFEKSIR